jgi:hypothetical protein
MAILDVNSKAGTCAHPALPFTAIAFHQICSIGEAFI